MGIRGVKHGWVVVSFVNGDSYQLPNCIVINRNNNRCMA